MILLDFGVKTNDSKANKMNIKWKLPCSYCITFSLKFKVLYSQIVTTSLYSLPGNSHGWRSLVCCSPRGHEESDMTEQLHFHFSLSCNGEGNATPVFLPGESQKEMPLQCSCQENPRDRGTWWAAVFGVAQSQTRLSDLA